MQAKQAGEITFVCWNVAGGRSRMKRVGDFLSSMNSPPHVIALQEIRADLVDDLVKTLQINTGVTWYNSHVTADHIGNAIVSRYPFRLEGRYKSSDFKPVATLEMRSLLGVCLETPEGYLLRVAVTHLDHREEEDRIHQMKGFQQCLEHWSASVDKALADDSNCIDFPRPINFQAGYTTPSTKPRDKTEGKEEKRKYWKLVPGWILMGDFNALNRPDYSDAGWEAIARSRRTNHWRFPPSGELLELILGPKGLRYHDSRPTKTRPSKPFFQKRSTNSTSSSQDSDDKRQTRSHHSLDDSNQLADDDPDHPAGTSRFNTRIDYILASADMMNGTPVQVVGAPTDNNGHRGDDDDKTTEKEVLQWKEYGVVPSNVSDHNVVRATLTIAVFHKQ